MISTRRIFLKESFFSAVVVVRLVTARESFTFSPSQIATSLPAPTAASASVFVSLDTSSKSLSGAKVADSLRPVPASSPAILGVPSSAVSVSAPLVSVDAQLMMPSLSAPATSGSTALMRWSASRCSFTHVMSPAVWLSVLEYGAAR